MYLSLSHVFCVDVGFLRHCILFQSWFHLHPYMSRDMVFYSIMRTILTKPFQLTSTLCHLLLTNSCLSNYGTHFILQTYV